MSGASARFALPRDEWPADLQPPATETAARASAAATNPTAASKPTADPRIGLGLEAEALGERIDALSRLVTELQQHRDAFEAAVVDRRWLDAARALAQIHALSGHAWSAISQRKLGS